MLFTWFMINVASITCYQHFRKRFGDYAQSVLFISSCSKTTGEKVKVTGTAKRFCLKSQVDPNKEGRAGEDGSAKKFIVGKQAF